MAKELYVEKFLSDDMIVAGKQLIPRLEAIMPVTGSFWLYTSEAEAWRLYVVTPRVLTDGIRKVYDTILNVLTHHLNMSTFCHWFVCIPQTTMIIMYHYCAMCVSAMNSSIAG